MIIELTEQQKQNLLVFLGRVHLTGQEAAAFMEIIQAIEKLNIVSDVNQRPEPK